MENTRTQRNTDIKSLGKLPNIPLLQELEKVRDTYDKFIEKVDTDELRLTGKLQDGILVEVPFPYAIINKLCTMTFEEIVCYEEKTVRSWAWDLTSALFRIQIHENRIAKIQKWFDRRLNKALGMVPEELLGYKDKDTKLCMLGNEYRVVAWLLHESEQYDHEAIYWKNIYDNVNRRFFALEYRSQSLKELEDDAT